MNKNDPILMCFPTSVILIDDDINFLDTAKKYLNNIPEILTFSSVKDTLDHISSTHHVDLTSKVITTIENSETDSDGELFELCLKNTLDYAKDKEKSKIMSVAIVDYSLPGENSLDFCRFARSIGLRTIMLTGVGTDKVAIEAFNEGLINRFVSKYEEDLFFIIKKVIEEEMKAFFVDLHNKVISCFLGVINLPINNTAYLKKFKDVLKISKAVEYYLIDHNGSYVFVDELGNNTIFFCQKNADIEKYINLAVDNDADSDFVQTLRKKNKILFLLSGASACEPVSSWGKYLYEAEKIGEGLYCAVINQH